MANEIRAHLEATGPRYLTASDDRNVHLKTANNRKRQEGPACVPDGVANDTQRCARPAGSDGFIPTTSGRFHQALAGFIHLADQEGF